MLAPAGAWPSLKYNRKQARGYNRSTHPSLRSRTSHTAQSTTQYRKIDKTCNGRRGPRFGHPSECHFCAAIRSIVLPCAAIFGPGGFNATSRPIHSTQASQSTQSSICSRTSTFKPRQTSLPSSDNFESQCLFCLSILIGLIGIVCLSVKSS